ncbi:MAG: hypothetical protein K2M13_06555 [Muribaculaceae bacterium]|nr:hypothetical protein [Muribaculaceae bacterium]
MDINKELKTNKIGLLSYFRSRANEILSELALKYSPSDFKKKASALNKAIIQCKENLLAIVYECARAEQWSNQELLECILMITYTNDVVMLEARNSIWEYEYMAFSRRVGELWEPFCKLCFIYPLTNIRLFVPPLFEEVKQDLTNEISDYIAGLKIKTREKARLMRYYDKVWGLVTSGDIQLECDLHFTDGTNKYIVDFKSSFGSNEKGNTNRLLLVGSIYQNIESDKYNCLIFVRSSENNHYLTTLQNSGVWKISCGIDAYEQICYFTGYDIHNWINENIDWINDFTPQMRETIERNGLENYLIW